MSAALGSNANTAGKINVNEIKLTSATPIATCLSNICRAQIPGVYAFAHDHARVVPQFPSDLPAANINRIDLCGAALQKAISEAAGRGSHIQAGFAFHRHLEMLEGGLQLETATSDILIGTLDFYGSVPRNQKTRLVGLLTGDDYPPRHDGSLRLFAGFAKAFHHQKLIDPRFTGHPSNIKNPVHLENPV